MISKTVESMEAWTKPTKAAFDFWVSFWPVAPVFGVEYRFADALPRFTPRILETGSDTETPKKKAPAKAKAIAKAKPSAAQSAPVAKVKAPAPKPAKSAKQAAPKAASTPAASKTTAKLAAPKAVAKPVAPKANAKSATPKAAAPKIDAVKAPISKPVVAKPEAAQAVAPKVEAKAEAPKASAPKPATPAAPSDGRPGNLMTTPPAKADDLKLIKGVGPSLEKQLNGLGIYTFEQMAAFSDADLGWIDDHLTAFKGRCFRDDWVGQARSKIA